jgi:hypothetical protein
MTGQIADTVLFSGEEYQIIGIAGKELFTPVDYGIYPEMLGTACYRGFFATYRIDGERICLDRLTIRDRDKRYPALDGVLPDAGSVEKEGAAVYRNVGIPLSFSGKLRLARDFTDKLYVHMGFQKPSAFRTVLDLSFKKGVLSGILDRSEEAARIRDQFIEKSRDMPRELVPAFIMKSFSLDMEELK